MFRPPDVSSSRTFARLEDSGGLPFHHTPGMIQMPLLPDSGEPGNMHEQLGIGDTKPELLTDTTWRHICLTYQLRGEIGKGGQAVVFSVKEKASPHRKLVLKVYHENTDASRKSFENECRFLASDRLPTEVVGYYQCVAERNVQPYLVLEFIDGTTLAKLADTSVRPLPFDIKADLIEQLARSFHRLHQCNVVFGDASANNILIEQDHRIRFVDLAGAKELIKGHGRSRSSINLVTPGFFAQTDADATAMKQVRTNLWSDLYALSANAFLLLTGRCEDQCRSGGSRAAEREWEQALIQAGVPRGLRMSVLKGLRVPDPMKSNDPRLYATAEAFANDVAAWKSQQRQRRSALIYGVPALVCVIALAVLALVGWTKYEAERTAFETRRFEGLQDRVTKLSNVAQPAIQSLIHEADELGQQRGEQLAARQTGLATATLRQMNQKLEQALDTSAALEPCLELRLALGQELIANSAEAIIPWLTDCPKIGTSLAGLVTRHATIKTQLDSGRTREAYAALVALQKDILKLKRDNDRAGAGRETQRRYDALRSSLSDRLRNFPEFDTIDSLARGGREDWKHGDWDAAERNIGQATQRLNAWLEQNESAEERQARNSQLQADREAGLRQDVARLTADRDTARNERDGLQTSLAALNTQLKAKDALIAKEKSRADSLTNDMASQSTQIKTLTAEKKDINEQLQREQAAVKKHLAEVERWKTRADDAEKLITSLPTNPGDAGAATQIILDASKIAAAIEARLKVLDPSDRVAAQKLLGEAVQALSTDNQQLAKLQGERVELLKSVAEGGEDVVKLDGKISAVRTATARKEEAVRKALAKLDEADQVHFNEIDAGIDQMSKLVAEWTDPQGRRKLLPTHPEVVTLKNQIAAQRRQQEPYAAGTARAAGTGKKLTIDEIIVFAQVAGTIGPVDTSGLKAGDLRVITVKGIETRWRWIPAGKFKMGSPANEKGRDSDEDQVDVTLSQGFWMLETEVTQELYETVTGKKLDWSSEYGLGPKHPVYNVSYSEAVEFCSKFNALLKTVPAAAGLMARLPTEAEWEYAARAGTTTRYYWGDRDEDADAYAWHSGNSNGSTQPVGQKKANQWNLCDMSGNVLEWCADGYAEKLNGGTDPHGLESASDRVDRGGSRGNPIGGGALRSAERDWGSFGNRYYALGFRMACSSVKG